MSQNQHGFVRDRAVKFNKLYVIEHRGVDGKNPPDMYWVSRHDDIEGKIADVVGHTFEDVNIRLDHTPTRYANQKMPTYLGEVIIKLAGTETHRIDLDNEGFPRMTLHFCLLPETVDIDQLGGEASDFLRTFIGK